MPDTASPEETTRKPYVVLFGLPIGRAQILAGLMLLAFAGQALYLARRPLQTNEIAQIQQGQALLTGGEAVSTHAPLVPLLAAAAVAGSGTDLAARDTAFYFPRLPQSWRWRARLPFVFIGVLLGASLWYVARRLFGTRGGFVALALYAFSPPLVSRAASVQPSVIAAWGAFGAVFTAIAVAHTLYAPREVVLWNWKRIALLGISFALAFATQPALIGLLPLALAFLFYLAPERRRAAFIIWAAACVAASALLLTIYAFHFAALRTSLAGFEFAEFSPGLLGRRLTWSLLGVFFLRIPGALLVIFFSLLTYAAWKRPRYFGPTSALLVWALLMVGGVVLPHLGGYNLFLVSLPFAYVFAAGVCADLMESEQGALVTPVLAGILLAHAAFSVLNLPRLPLY